MGRAFNWEEEWGQEEMSVGELGRRMMAEEWSMNEEAVTWATGMGQVQEGVLIFCLAVCSELA